MRAHEPLDWTFLLVRFCGKLLVEMFYYWTFLMGRFHSLDDLDAHMRAVP